MLALHLAHSFTYCIWENVHPFCCCSIFVLNWVKMQVEFLYPCKTSRASSSRSAAKWFTSAQPYFKGLTGFKTTACTCPLILNTPIYEQWCSICGICHRCSFQLNHVEFGFQRNICNGSTPVVGAAEGVWAESSCPLTSATSDEVLSRVRLREMSQKDSHLERRELWRVWGCSHMHHCIPAP